MKKLLPTVVSLVALGGCATIPPEDLQHIDSKKIDHKYSYLQGIAFEQNATPYTDQLLCVGGQVQSSDRNWKNFSIAVGAIEDLTGKFDYDNGGYKVTQGASDMMTSSLLRPGIFRVVERNRMDISNFERTMANQSLVKDFTNTDNPALRKVTAGEITGSDYRVVGSINEMNYNIASSGAEVGIAGAGIDGRVYVADIGMDLFLVHTTSTEIVDMVSIRKQLVGYETKSGIYRFFDNELFDISVGNKKQEPIQLAIRSAMEYAVIEFSEHLHGQVDECKG